MLCQKGKAAESTGCKPDADKYFLFTRLGRSGGRCARGRRSSDHKNEEISSGVSGAYTADNGTDGGDASGGGTGGDGGNGGSVTVNDTVTGTIGGAIEITATGGDGALGGRGTTASSQDQGPHGDSGAGGDSKVAVAVRGSGITTVNNITVAAKAGSGSTIFVHATHQSDGANGDKGGSAAAIGLQAAGSNTLVTITAADITISAEGGNGGYGISSYSNGGVGGMGGAAEAYGLKAATNSFDLTINDIRVTAKRRCRWCRWRWW